MIYRCHRRITNCVFIVDRTAPFAFYQPVALPFDNQHSIVRQACAMTDHAPGQIQSVHRLDVCKCCKC
jgi:hypothetical protein